METTPDGKPIIRFTQGGPVPGYPGVQMNRVREECMPANLPLHTFSVYRDFMLDPVQHDEVGQRCREAVAAMSAWCVEQFGPSAFPFCDCPEIDTAQPAWGLFDDHFFIFSNTTWAAAFRIRWM